MDVFCDDANDETNAQKSTKHLPKVTRNKNGNGCIMLRDINDKLPAGLPDRLTEFPQIESKSQEINFFFKSPNS